VPIRRDWTHPRSIVRHCTLFHPAPAPSAPRKPTRLDNALEENRALKEEVERFRRAGDDYGFRREDRATDIADLVLRSLSEHKSRAVMIALVRRFGTHKQCEAFGIKDDIPKKCGAESGLRQGENE
jgi:hypothetical protein